MPDTRRCPGCGRRIPTTNEDGEPVYPSHAKGFKQGACPAGGDPVDTPPSEYHVPSSDLEEDPP